MGRHLVAAELLEDSDNETAQAHARFAARLGGRVGAVREFYGVIAYRAGDFRTASRELRTSLRITGRTDVLPMIADSERGLGRPERALDIAASDDAADLGVDAAIELIIVVAGAYADTGDVDTALRTLEIPALRHKVDGRWQVRLWVAYADLLERAGRQEEAKRWMTLAADADTEGLTDAAERLGRPAPAPAEEPTWADDEQVAVLDAYDPDAETDEPDLEGCTDDVLEDDRDDVLEDDRDDDREDDRDDAGEHRDGHPGGDAPQGDTADGDAPQAAAPERDLSDDEESGDEPVGEEAERNDPEPPAPAPAPAPDGVSAPEPVAAQHSASERGPEESA
ncbi:hypothetical protein ACT3SP_17890 [Brachybacterium sp. AOP43-C2-M15]|uniref:hypothetical protein n=1 Tax=Brachybacterium sp. AOP43-C2-M15 TaxID=3457661 RepID=UPI004034E62C